MPQCSREAAFTALFNLLGTAIPPINSGQWSLTGRKLVDWDSVATASQPAFFLHEGIQTTTEETFALPQYVWQSQLWIYFRADGSDSQDTPPDTIVNGFLDAFDKVMLAPYPGNRQTLGGLVYHCRIQGTTAFDSGLSDGQGVILVPIEILVGV